MYWQDTSYDGKCSCCDDIDVLLMTTTAMIMAMMTVMIMKVMMRIAVIPIIIVMDRRRQIQGWVLCMVQRTRRTV